MEHAYFLEALVCCWHAAKLTLGAVCVAIRSELAKPPEPFRPVSAEELGWKQYLPIRKMTTEEHERHLERKAKREEYRYCPSLRWKSSYPSGC